MSEPLPTITTRCPFCSGTIVVPRGMVSVSHTLPTCERFDALTPVEFLSAVNTEIMTKLGVGRS